MKRPDPEWKKTASPCLNGNSVNVIDHGGLRVTLLLKARRAEPLTKPRKSSCVRDSRSRPHVPKLVLWSRTAQPTADILHDGAALYGQASPADISILMSKRKTLSLREHPKIFLSMLRSTISANFSAQRVPPVTTFCVISRTVDISHDSPIRFWDGSFLVKSDSRRRRHILCDEIGLEGIGVGGFVPRHWSRGNVQCSNPPSARLYRRRRCGHPKFFNSSPNDDNLFRPIGPFSAPSLECSAFSRICIILIRPGMKSFFVNTGCRCLGWPLW